MTSTSRKRRGSPMDQSEKRPRVELEMAAAIGNDADEFSQLGVNYFESLPDDILSQIISLVPGAYWPVLESVDRRFQRATIESWRVLKDVDLEKFATTRLATKGALERQAMLASLLKALLERSPMVRSISGFFVIVENLSVSNCDLLVQFNHLRIVDFSFCRLQTNCLARFLLLSESRGQLQQLRLVKSLVCTPKNYFPKKRLNDGRLREAFTNSSRRPDLKLKAFVYQANLFCEGTFLECLDVSELESLSFGSFDLGASSISTLLRRCERLQSFNYGMDFDWIDRYYEKTSLAVQIEISGRQRNGTVILVPSEQMQKTFHDLAGRSCLRSLSITNCKCLRDTIVDAIGGNLASLENVALDVTSCSSSALVRLVTSLQRLKKLEFRSRITPSLAINDRVINAIVSFHAHLHCLRLDAPGVGPEKLKTLNGLAQLKHLFVSGKSVVNNTLIHWCGGFGSGLETLELPGTMVSDAGVAVTTKHMRSLRRLNLENTTITDISLRVIGKSCLDLREIGLSGCGEITKKGVQAVLDGCTNLQRLHLKKTKIDARELVCSHRGILLI